MSISESGGAGVKAGASIAAKLSSCGRSLTIATTGSEYGVGSGCKIHKEKQATLVHQTSGEDGSSSLPFVITNRNRSSNESVGCMPLPSRGIPT